MGLYVPRRLGHVLVDDPVASRDQDESGPLHKTRVPCVNSVIFMKERDYAITMRTTTFDDLPRTWFPYPGPTLLLDRQGISSHSNSIFWPISAGAVSGWKPCLLIPRKRSNASSLSVCSAPARQPRSHDTGQREQPLSHHVQHLPSRCPVSSSRSSRAVLKPAIARGRIDRLVWIDLNHRQIQWQWSFRSLRCQKYKSVSRMSHPSPQHRRIIERRKHPRSVTPAGALVSFKQLTSRTGLEEHEHHLEGEGTLIDLSLGGCRLHSDMPLDFSARYHLILQISKASCPILVDVAIARWAQEQSYGVKFTFLQSIHESHLRELLRDIRRHVP